MPVQNTRARGFSTQQVHAGSTEPTSDGVNPRALPIHATAGFVFDDFDQAADRFGEVGGYSYTRVGNPTSAAVERRLAVLEGGADALLLASGQAAVTAALLGLVGAGDHVLAASSIYEGTRGLLLENLARLGVEVDFVDAANDPDAWLALVRPTTRVFFAESIPNPKNDVLDVAVVAEAAHAAGVPLVIDNTLATPYLLRPLEHGADVVVHSASKFLAGHGTVLGGAVVFGDRFDWSVRPGFYPHLTTPGRDGRSLVDRHGVLALAAYVRDSVALRFGPTPSPFSAFLIQQGIETLSLRMDRHSANALAVARWLEQQPEVLSVDYAGLESNEYHEIAKRYLTRGFGSVFSFTLAGGAEIARTVIDAVEVFTRMTHLGDVRSLILHPASTSHVLRSPEEQRRSGIWPGLIRISVGIEDVEDLVADLDAAFEVLRAASRGSLAGERADDASGAVAAARVGAAPAAAVVRHESSAVAR
jgi:O-acetylhomoserine (thiol)-lyase